MLNVSFNVFLLLKQPGAEETQWIKISIFYILSGLASRSPVTHSTNLGSASLMSELDMRHGYQLTNH